MKGGEYNKESKALVQQERKRERERKKEREREKNGCVS